MQPPAQRARLCTCAHKTQTEVEADVSDMPAIICARLQAQQSDVACVGFGADGQIPNRSSRTVDTGIRVQARRGGRAQFISHLFVSITLESPLNIKLPGPAAAGIHILLIKNR